MKQIMKKIGRGLLIAAGILLFVPWFLNLFGLIEYEIPTSQRPENIVQVDLLNHKQGEFTVLCSLTGNEISPFMDELLKLKAGRYSNDPPLEYGKQVIKLCYADGGYDLLGGMVEFFSPNGESIHTRGWYYLHRKDLEALFSNYLP